VNLIGKCAYCGKVGPLTKEEVFPKFLAHKIRYTTFVDRRRGLKPLRLPPVQRDVCQHCNNILLGRLDTYVSAVCKSYFLVPVSPPVDISFKYDFRLLHRWLLKVLYNFARATGDRTDVFQRHVPYILGECPEPETDSVVLLGVFEAAQAQSHEVAAGLPQSFTPFCHTIGHIKFSNVRWVRGCLSLAYCATFESYCFQVIDFCGNTPLHIRKEVLNQILSETRLLLLGPRDSEVRITQSLDSARGFLFNQERARDGIYRFSGTANA